MEYQEKQTGETIRHLHLFGIKSYCFDDFTAPTDQQEKPTGISEVTNGNQ